MKATLSFPSHPTPSHPLSTLWKDYPWKGKKGWGCGWCPTEGHNTQKVCVFFFSWKKMRGKKESGISFGTHTVLSGAICGLWKKVYVKTRIKEIKYNPSQPLPAAWQGCSKAGLEQLCCEHWWHFSFSASNVQHRATNISTNTNLSYPLLTKVKMP